jgi:hypothetical protein
MAKFCKGESGNKSGRPKGIKDSRVRLRELFKPHAEELIKKAVEMALGGDTTAMRLCLERFVPPMRSESEPANIGEISGTLAEQGQSIITAMGSGRLTPSQAVEMLGALASQARICEADELEKRIQALEQKLKSGGGHVT